MLAVAGKRRHHESGTAYLDPRVPPAKADGCGLPRRPGGGDRIVPILHVEYGGDGIRAFNVTPASL